MSHKILSVSILENTIDILRLEQRITNTYRALGELQRDVDQKTLGKAAKWADQILINADFPGAEYTWSNFPKVTNRILKQLVFRQAVQYLETRQGIRVAYQDQGTTTEDAMVKRRVSSLAIHEDEIIKLERGIFAKYRKKIHLVTSLPVALCAAVVQSEQPKKDFMVVWVGEMSAVLAISSPQGDIKVARNIPVSLHLDDIADDDLVAFEGLSQEFDRDIMTTLLLYNDTVEAPSCESFYLLGNAKLSKIFETFPVQSVGGRDVFSLSDLPVQNLNGNGTRSYHVLGNLFSGYRYNLVDSVITWGQKFDRGYKFASILLVGCLATTAAWVWLTASSGEATNESLYAEKIAELEEINTRLYKLKSEGIELKRFNGWKNFYKNTYTNQPAWSKMFSSLAAEIPEEFVVNSLEINPGKTAGIHGWRAILTGEIKSTRWNDGLDLLREFGTKFHQSPYFEIVGVQYTPLEDNRDAGSHETSFDVVINMTLTPQGNK